jgi:hypothetical protein
MNANCGYRVWLYAAAAFIACFYVHFYNALELGKSLVAKREIIVLAQIFMALEWWAFLVPATGFGLALARRRTANSRLLSITADVLAMFAVGWILAALFVWQAQQPPIARFPSER